MSTACEDQIVASTFHFSETDTVDDTNLREETRSVSHEPCSKLVGSSLSHFKGPCKITVVCFNMQK